MAKRRKLSSKSRQKLQRGFAIIALLALLAAIILVAVLDRRVTKQFEGRRWTLPARVYAHPLELYVGQNVSSARTSPRNSRASGTSRRGRRTGPARTAAKANASTSTSASSGSPTRRRLRSNCASGSTASDLDAGRTRGRRRPGVPARSVADRQHLSDSRRRSHHRVAGPGAPAVARSTEGRRRPQVRLTPRRQPAGDPARVVRQRPRGSGRAGRQHADAAAREELLPRQPPHAPAQGRGSRSWPSFSNRDSRRRTS